MDLRKSLHDIVRIIAGNFAIDHSEKKVGTTDVPSWNTALLCLSYLVDGNVLLLGEPGFGKTTTAKVVSSFMSGLPYDLYEVSQIQGHPEQTKEEMLARPDFAQLSEKEAAVWQMAAYLPSVILDEVNCLPQGKQTLLLNFIQTGRLSYLNDTLYSGRKFFVATANHAYDGNQEMIPPLRDRFTLSIELGFQGAMTEDRIETCAKPSIEQYLCSDTLVRNITQVLQSKVGPDEVHSNICATRQTFSQSLGDMLECPLLSEDHKKLIAASIKQMPVSPHARVFYNTLRAEANYDPKRGLKRSCEDPLESNHAKTMASAYVRNAQSARAGIESVLHLAKAVAWYVGDAQVEKKHIRAIAPNALAHRLEFTSKFEAEHKEADRTANVKIYFHAPNEQMFLVDKMMDSVDKNYTTSVQPHMELLYTYMTDPSALSGTQRSKARELVKNEKSLDHPLIKEFVYHIKRRR